MCRLWFGLLRVLKRRHLVQIAASEDWVLVDRAHHIAEIVHLVKGVLALANEILVPVKTIGPAHFVLLIVLEILVHHYV